MTEQEMRRRRREMERRMRTRAGGKKEKKGGLAVFRLYVTAVLTGGCLVISQFHTETSEMICEKLKAVLSEQISAEELTEWKERAWDYLQEKKISLPVFVEDEKQEEKVYHPDIKDSP